LEQQTPAFLRQNLSQRERPLLRINQSQPSRIVSYEVEFRADRFVVLIDADNARASIIEPLLKELRNMAPPILNESMGDWTSNQ